MAYILFFAGHDQDLLGRWETLLFNAGFEVVSSIEPPEPVHTILGRASELMELYRSLPEDARPLGLVMRASTPCAPIMVIAGKDGLRHVNPPLEVESTPEEFVTAMRKSVSA